MPKLKFPILTTLIAAGAVVASIGSVPAILQLDRQQPFDLWRLATCHLTHWSTQHLFWDLLVFIALGAVCELRDRKRTAATMAISALAISGLVLCMPNLRFYRGLSGIDSALFMLLCAWILHDSSRGGRRILRMAVLAFMGLFVAKLAIEAALGAAIFVDSADAGFTPTPLVHLVGAEIGAIVSVEWALPTICVYRRSVVGSAHPTKCTPARP